MLLPYSHAISLTSVCLQQCPVLGRQAVSNGLGSSSHQLQATINDSSICDQHLPWKARAEMTVCLGLQSSGIAIVSSGKKR